MRGPSGSLRREPLGREENHDRLRTRWCRLRLASIDRMSRAGERIGPAPRKSDKLHRSAGQKRVVDSHGKELKQAVPQEGIARCLNFWPRRAVPAGIGKRKRTNRLRGYENRRRELENSRELENNCAGQHDTSYEHCRPRRDRLHFVFGRMIESAACPPSADLSRDRPARQSSVSYLTRHHCLHIPVASPDCRTQAHLAAFCSILFSAACRPSGVSQLRLAARQPDALCLA
jgi:hypothetical protein